LALLSAACSNDSASRINGPPLLSSSSNDRSAAASNFAVLANAEVTCTRGTITGDVGTFLAPPAGKVTLNDGCLINGTVHNGDAAAISAYNAFLGEYKDVANTRCTGSLNTVYTDVAFTLRPGVYCNAADVTFTRTTLTLDGRGNQNAVWIFKIGTGGTGALTGTDLSVIWTGANPCNVTWWTAQGATITDDQAGVPHPFVGTILAGAAITTTGTNTAGVPADHLSFAGDAFAKADVTMTDTDLVGCQGGKRNGKDKDKDKDKCNQGVGNGPEGCDPGKSNHGDDANSNDENGGKRGDPGRKGGD
jgi:Ice-binding-like